MAAETGAQKHTCSGTKVLTSTPSAMISDERDIMRACNHVVHKHVPPGAYQVQMGCTDIQGSWQAQGDAQTRVPPDEEEP